MKAFGGGDYLVGKANVRLVQVMLTHVMCLVTSPMRQVRCDESEALFKMMENSDEGHHTAIGGFIDW